MDLGNLKNLDVKDLVEKLKGMDLMSNKKLLIKFGIGFVSILIFLIIYYFFVSPTVKFQNEQILIMNENTKKEIQSATFERLLKHLDERKDVQNIDLMNLANFCRNCLSRWYREEAEKKGVSISDPDAREYVYGMPYPEWKEKYQK